MKATTTTNKEKNMKTQIVTLRTDLTTLTNSFHKGDTFRVLGYQGTMIRVSRTSDRAKLITPMTNFGIELPSAPVTSVPAPRVESTVNDTPHTDESGPSRRIVICSVLAGKDSGETAMHMTPAEEREYNRGMAMLAELG
jgi:hypothetical protein